MFARHSCLFLSRAASPTEASSPTFSTVTSAIVTGLRMPPSSRPTAIGKSSHATGVSARARTHRRARSSGMPSANEGNVTIAVPLFGAIATSQMENLATNASRSISGSPSVSSSAAPDAEGGSVRNTRTSARRWYFFSFAASRSNASGRSSVVLPFAVWHSEGISNANAPGGGGEVKPPSGAHRVRSDPSSHAPSHRTNFFASSTSSPSLCASAGMFSPMGAGSFADMSTVLALRTSFVPPLASLASASASAPDTKSGMANTGGSTLSTRRPRTLRSTGRNRSASDPRYACWFWGLCVLGSSPPVSRTCGGSFDNTEAACDAVRSFSGGGQCHTREGASFAAARV
mmetsp:Transcript_13843/g.58203  ORF Transcript_13843/g.58203 Transcript_13843/m.58203 type:complete len:345 (+) Transcript_13843:352-1386(+)